MLVVRVIAEAEMMEAIDVNVLYDSACPLISYTMVKDRVFAVNLKHDGIFITDPFGYINGDEKQLTDVDFEGLKELKAYEDVHEFMRLGYENKWVIDLHAENFDYDVLDFIDAPQNDIQSENNDEYSSSDEQE
ncbi:hypothetical protein Tco_0381330 [Tanacetum coccineum]